jgi:hypothetical protein
MNYKIDGKCNIFHTFLFHISLIQTFDHILLKKVNLKNSRMKF